MKPPSLTERRQMVITWNRLFSVGQPVIVTLDSGAEITAKTTAPAQLLGGHTPVIWLDVIIGGYMLSRVRPADMSNLTETAAERMRRDREEATIYPPKGPK